MSPDDRRPFRGAPFDRGRNNHPPGPGPDRGDRPPVDRPGFGAPRPFIRAPTRGGDMAAPDHSVRLRDGDREIEVSGNPAFVRQVLDDLPTLMARLRGELPGRTTISMPAPPSPAPAAQLPVLDRTSAPTAIAQVGRDGDPQHSPSAGNGNARSRSNGSASSAAATPSLEDRVFEVLRASTRPLAIAAIRQRLDGAAVTGQQVRRLLERAGARVTVSSDRPATYSLR